MSIGWVKKAPGCFPMMLMGLIAFVGPILQNYVGERKAILGALLAICGMRPISIIGNKVSSAIPCKLKPVAVRILAINGPIPNEKLFLVHCWPFVEDVLSVFYCLHPKD
jgi:hypothetical protein